MHKHNLSSLKGNITLFTQIDEFPLNQEVALQLAGLQAQVLWGDYVQSKVSRYDEIEQFLHTRIIAADRRKTREDWKRAIANTHKVRTYVRIPPTDCWRQ